jgi:hypothetical protein
MNPEGQLEFSGLHSHSKITGLLHKFRICGSLSRNIREGGKPREARSKMKEAREIEALSSYLIGLLNNPSFTLRYFESNHVIRGCYGPTRGNL